MALALFSLLPPDGWFVPKWTARPFGSKDTNSRRAAIGRTRWWLEAGPGLLIQRRPSSLYLVAVDRFRRKRGHAHSDIFRSLRLRRAIADPFPFGRDHSLTGTDVDCAPVMFHS
jgi:hypothetical protein